MLGAAETVVGLTNSFKVVPDKRGLYVPNIAAASSSAPKSSPRLIAVGGAR
jgi:chemotaxis protein methyltransferase CheR